MDSTLTLSFPRSSGSQTWGQHTVPKRFFHVVSEVSVPSSICNPWKKMIVKVSVVGGLASRSGHKRLAMYFYKYCSPANTKTTLAFVNSSVKTFKTRKKKRLTKQNAPFLTRQGGTVSRQRFHTKDWLTSPPLPPEVAIFGPRRKERWHTALA